MQQVPDCLYKYAIQNYKYKQPLQLGELLRWHFGFKYIPGAYQKKLLLLIPTVGADACLEFFDERQYPRRYL